MASLKNIGHFTPCGKKGRKKVSVDLSELLGKSKEEQKQLKQKVGTFKIWRLLLSFATKLDTQKPMKEIDASYYAAASSSQYEDFVCNQRCPW